MFGANARKIYFGGQLKLKYPKSMISKKEVEYEKNMFEFPDAWEITQNKKEYILALNPRKFVKTYMKKQQPLIKGK